MPFDFVVVVEYIRISRSGSGFLDPVLIVTLIIVPC